MRPFAVGATVLLLLTLLTPAVAASDFRVSPRGRTVQLEPLPSFPSNDTVDLASLQQNTSATIQLEKDGMPSEFLEPGRYLGPYVRSSHFRFTYEVDGNFSFESRFNFTRAQIMSGASTFWVRWPVLMSNFKYVCLRIMDLPRAGKSLDYCEGDKDTTVFVYDGVPPDPVIVPGPTIHRNLGDLVLRTPSGVYAKYFAFLLPNTEYGFRVEGFLKRGTAPEVWATIERYQTSNLTTYTFADFLTGAPVHTQTLPLYPAFAFNFVAGIGTGGLTSYRMPFVGDNTTYIRYRHCTTLVSGCHPVSYDDHLSFYIPFAGQDKVTWNVSVAWSSICLPTPCVAPKSSWTVTGTRDFLLVSSPMNLTQAGFCDNADPSCFPAPPPGKVYVNSLADINPIISIWADKPLNMLGVANTQLNLTRGSWPWWQLHLGGSSSFELPCKYSGGSCGPDSIVYETDVFGASNIALFLSTSWTSGRWATVTPGQYYATYDFGWGRAYLFPGQVNLVMFLNNGTAVGFDSVDVVDISQPDCKVFDNPAVDWLNGFACWILQRFGDVIGFIASVFQTIWNALKQLGDWIYNALVGFFQTLTNIAMAIIDIAVDIVTSFLFVMPFMLVLFVVGRGLPDTSEAASALGNVRTKVSSAWRRGLRFTQSVQDRGTQFRSRFSRKPPPGPPPSYVDRERARRTSYVERERGR